MKKLILPKFNDILSAAEKIDGRTVETPLLKAQHLSEKLSAEIYVKPECLQRVGAFKFRGAFNRLCRLTDVEKKRGVVAYSSGNHAQGVALSCKLLKVKGVVFMPITTPNQKTQQVVMFGGEFIEVKLIGDTYDESFAAAKEYCEVHRKTFVHPFDDELIIAGQGTVGIEILEDAPSVIDVLILPVGGGGLASGVGSVFRNLSPQTKIIGVEPTGAPSLTTSLRNNKNTELKEIEKFVDGASVKKMGDRNFAYCKEVLDAVLTIDEGLVCSTILKVYNENALVVEPAGALSIAALEHIKDDIVGKNIVCIVSGGNNDITRMEEMKERALLYDGLKHYFLVKFYSTIVPSNPLV